MGSALSGHRMAPSALVTRTMATAARRLPEVMQALIDRALATPFKCEHCGEMTTMGPGDREAQIYLLDRVMGRPRQEVQIDAQVGIQLQPGDYARLSRLQQAIACIDVPAHDTIERDTGVGHILSADECAIEGLPLSLPTPDNGTIPTDPDKP